MLAFVNGSGRKLVLLIALAAVVGVTVFGAVYSVYRSVKRPSAPPAAGEELTFMCDACSAVFARLEGELPPGFNEDRMAGRAAAIDCPKCGAEACAYVPHRCPDPQCAKHYLTDACRYPRRPGPRGPESDRCPHCGTVPYEWYLQHKP